MDNIKVKKLKSLILKGIGLAMGIAVLVLNVLGNIDNSDSIRLLSIGLIAYGLEFFQDKSG